MKNFSAFLETGRYKNWARKISSWEYLTLWRRVLPVLSWVQSASFLLSTLNSYKRCWRPAAAAALDLIFVEVDNGLPGGASGKEPACQCRRLKRLGFSPWVGKIPWRRARQLTPVFLPGESHGQRSLGGYSPQVDGKCQVVVDTSMELRVHCRERGREKGGRGKKAMKENGVKIHKKVKEVSESGESCRENKTGGWMDGSGLGQLSDGQTYPRRHQIWARTQGGEPPAVELPPGGGRGGALNKVREALQRPLKWNAREEAQTATMGSRRWPMMAPSPLAPGGWGVDGFWDTGAKPRKLGDPFCVCARSCPLLPFLLFAFFAFCLHTLF